MKWASKLILPILLLALLSCGGDGSGGSTRDLIAANGVHNPRYLSLQETGHEYEVRTRSLRLPAGLVWPPSNKAIGGEGLFQQGFGITVAESYWLCAWESAWLAAGDAREASAALAQMYSVKSTQLYRVAYDRNTKRLTDRLLAAASVSDRRPVQDEVRLNCSTATPRH